MQIKYLIKILLRVMLYLIFGLAIFILTILFLRNQKENESNKLLVATKEDGLVFDASNDILNHLQNNGRLIVYLETRPCASCSSKAMNDWIGFFQDASEIEKPLLVFHPIIDIDSTIVYDYHFWFDDYFDVVITNRDSIMIKNPWMPERLGFYGILTDSLNNIVYAGSLFDDRLFAIMKAKL